MGLKFVLTVMIAMIISVAFFVELSNSGKKRKAFTKDLEFTNTNFIEVDTQKMLGWVYSTHGIRDKGVLIFDNVVFHTEKIDSLIGKKGKYKYGVLYLDGDVVMEENDGYTYTTQHANYNLKTEILKITSPYTAVRGKDVIKGKSLRYNTAKEVAFGKKVDAVIYTTEK